MDGFTNLDDTRSESSVGFSANTFRQRLDAIRRVWNNRSTLEKGLMIAVLALVVLSLGLIIGLATSAGKDSGRANDSSLSEVCLTPDCTKAASRILASLDQSVNPCSDFYFYACGSWKKKHVIPEDSSKIDAFSILGDKIHTINKNLYEDPSNFGTDEEAWRKAKDLYAACMNTELIEQKNLSTIIPILERLGGWPVLGPNPGGSWKEERFDLVDLLVKLAQYGIQPFIKLLPSPDSKNSKQHILYLDQPDVGLPINQGAYLQYAKSMAILFGANPEEAENQMQEMFRFQKQLINITMTVDDRQDEDTLYNKMTLSEIRRTFPEPPVTNPVQFNWSRFVSGVMNLEGVNITITESEPIVVRAVPYFKNLFGLLQQHPKRSIVNFIMWAIISESVLALPERFKERENKYKKNSSCQLLAKQRALSRRLKLKQERCGEESSGKETYEPRWRECEELTTEQMGMAISQKYVEEIFDHTIRQQAGDMIAYIRKTFNELLNENPWMDDATKKLAREKADAMKSMIGYPDDILRVSHVNELYRHVNADKTELLNIRKTEMAALLRNLREPYNKTSESDIWSEPPVAVNAFYYRQRNDIVIPVGILQSPAYEKNQPKSLNFGAIGAIIGHEITHGFDNTGRKYDKNGDLKQWWDQKIIENFNNQANCMVDQYENYVVPEANITVKGNLTLGENIADNGGVKQSYRAYRRWVQEQGKEEPKLPGLDLTHNQLFFISFAQIWCVNIDALAAKLLVQQDNHSPNQFRVIGTMQNSQEFAEAFSCPRNSYMNPVKKCSVW